MKQARLVHKYRIFADYHFFATQNWVRGATLCLQHYESDIAHMQFDVCQTRIDWSAAVIESKSNQDSKGPSYPFLAIPKCMSVFISLAIEEKNGNNFGILL